MRNRVVRSHLTTILVLWALSLLVSCGALGLAKPETVNQKLLYSYGSVTSLRLTARDYLESGAITAKEAADVQEKANAARVILDAARIANKVGDTSTAEAKLKEVQTLLKVAEGIIKSREGGGS